MMAVSEQVTGCCQLVVTACLRWTCLVRVGSAASVPGCRFAPRWLVQSAVKYCYVSGRAELPWTLCWL